MSASVADLITLHYREPQRQAWPREKECAGEKCSSLRPLLFGDHGCDRASTASQVS